MILRPARLLLGLLLLVGCAAQPHATSRAPDDARDTLLLELQQRVEDDPSDVLSCMALGELYEQLGQYGLAVHYYRKVVSQMAAGADTQPWLRLGRSLALEGRLEEARDSLRKVLAVRPKKADAYWTNHDYRQAHFLLGSIAERRNDLDLMCEHYREYLRLGGDQARVAHCRSRLTNLGTD